MDFPLFLIPILSGLIAQAIKPFLNKRALNRPGLPNYGGMPSAHTAFAVSLVTVVGLSSGIFTVSFALAVAFLIYTLDDALRMRIFLGRYGQALEKIVKNLPKEEQEKFPYVEPRLGHSPAEVIVGGVIGIIVTILVFSLI